MHLLTEKIILFIKNNEKMSNLIKAVEAMDTLPIKINDKTRNVPASLGRNINS